MKYTINIMVRFFKPYYNVGNNKRNVVDLLIYHLIKIINYISNYRPKYNLIILKNKIY